METLLSSCLEDCELLSSKMRYGRLMKSTNIRIYDTHKYHVDRVSFYRKINTLCRLTWASVSHSPRSVILFIIFISSSFSSSKWFGSFRYSLFSFGPKPKTLNRNYVIHLSSLCSWFGFQQWPFAFYQDGFFQGFTSSIVACNC